MTGQETPAQRLRRQAAEMREAASRPTQGGKDEDRILREIARRLEQNAERLERDG